MDALDNADREIKAVEVQIAAIERALLEPNADTAYLCTAHPSSFLLLTIYLAKLSIDFKRSRFTPRLPRSRFLAEPEAPRT